VLQAATFNEASLSALEVCSFIEQENPELKQSASWQLKSMDVLKSSRQDDTTLRVDFENLRSEYQ
jgi:hypothetical protein